MKYSGKRSKIISRLLPFIFSILLLDGELCFWMTKSVNVTEPFKAVFCFCGENE